jgi:hypothetical protein
MKLSKIKLLLAGTSCAVIAACSSASISSPGEENQVDPPENTSGVATSLSLIPSSGCPSNSASQSYTISVDGADVDVSACGITGTLLTDTELTSDGVYFLDGPVFVGQDGGASVTLTIPAGATIVGSSGADYIVVSRGSQIDAQGTDTSPIVMTSALDELESRVGTPRTIDDTNRGEWGGLIVNGFAPINACIDGTATGGTADCQKSGEGSSGLFGGDQPADSSGTLSYVQVKYAGFQVNADDELNGIAFQATGSGTTAEYLQVHNNADDGIEFFGGTTDAKYLVLTGNSDDSLDYTDGWVGRAQYVVVQQAADAGDQGFEFDNNGDDNSATPRSNPTISNFTLRGVRTSTSSDTGMLLREGTDGTFINGIVYDFEGDCLDVDQDSIDRANGGTLQVSSTFFDCTPNASTDDDGFDEAAFIAGTGFAHNVNNVEADNTMSGLFAGTAEQSVTVTAQPADGFFDAVDFVGAFSYGENESNNWALGWTFGLFEEPDCPSGTTETGEVIGGKRVCQLSGTYTDDLELIGGGSLVYELSGPVFIGEDVGAEADGGDAAILSIDAGITIMGASGADYLVVSRGSEIRANGTATAPIIMTSRGDVAGTNQSPNDDRGQWGGLVINGRAPINACIDGTATGGTVDCEKSGEGSSGLFGGTTSDDSSGSLSYVRVQYAGFQVNADDELNGIAFQGTGSGTTAEYLQVHNNADDGIEFFGGTTNAKYLVLTGNSDDSFDVTDGWTGNAQFVIVQHAADAGDQGFEMDNNGDDNAALPRSTPTIANFTLIGVRGSTSSDTGMLLREGLAGTFVNGVVVDFEGDCVDVDQDETIAQADAGNLVIASTFFDCTPNASTDTDGIDEADFISGAGVYTSNVNNVEGTTTLSGFTFVTDFSSLGDTFTPNNATGVVPGTAEAAVTVYDVTTLDAFFDDVGYVGAVEDADDTWYQGWTLVQD